MSIRLCKTLLFFVLACLCLRAAPLRVVALHSVLGELARETAGAEVEMLCLVPGGVDPHTFNPTPSDVRALTKADLVLASGYDLEPYLDKLVANSGTKARLFLVSSVLKDPVHASAGTHAHDHSEHRHGELDPHWWHSIANLKTVTLAIADELKTLRPDEAPGIEARAEAYVKRLGALSAWVDAELKLLPSSRRQLVTSHDAFGYLARDYGFSLHPLNGLSPEAETDARSLAQLIDFIKREKVPAVFVDNTENPKLLAAMLKESGAKVGGTLYADGLGPKGSPAETVEGMFRHNIGTLVLALRD